MNDDFSGNIERFTGFADLYDKHRPAPPDVLADLLTRLAKAPRPALVVDLSKGILMSQSSVMTLLKGGMSESQIGIDVFKQKIRHALSEELKPWYWCSRVRIGIV